MPSCPSCRRPVAVARASCLYCGATLDALDVAAVLSAAAQLAAEEEPRPPAGRALVILDVADANPATLAEALGVPRYEAGLLARRGGLQLHRALAEVDARAEADRLGSLGVTTLVVPQSEARVRPARVVWGRRTADGFSVRTQDDGPLEVPRKNLLLVVDGPIARERPPRFERRRGVEPARLDEGRRVHLHRRDDLRPLEIDPANFEAAGAAGASVGLEIDGWIAALGPEVPCDDGFRRLPPALSPAEPEPSLALAAAAALRARHRAGARADEPVLLDNVAQFRFYSGWRAAVERRRAAFPSKAC